MPEGSYVLIVSRHCCKRYAKARIVFYFSDLQTISRLSEKQRCSADATSASKIRDSL